MTNTPPNGSELPEASIERESGIRDRAALAESARQRLCDVPNIDPSILALADLDRPLSKEELEVVFEHIKLIVVAEDEPQLRVIVPRILSTTKRDGRARIKTLDHGVGSVSERFDRLSQFEQGDLPVIMCCDGIEADAALKEIQARGLRQGLYLSDINMPGRDGLSLIREHGNKLPGFGRVLQSTLHENTVNALKSDGLIDAFVSKPFQPDQAKDTYAKAFLMSQRSSK